jgi:DNA-directed RNA polymerase subunit RPC12/RpoP
MRNPEDGFELSASIRPISVCLNCGRSMKKAFSVPARHDLELRIFQCEHCGFEDLILRPLHSLPVPRQLTYRAAHADNISQAVFYPITVRGE